VDASRIIHSVENRITQRGSHIMRLMLFENKDTTKKYFKIRGF
jgi:hypothetical protein